MKDALPIEHLYYTENSLDKILDNLDKVRQNIFPNLLEEKDLLEQSFPSVCLIGLGRCGSNIALDVATLVYNSRTHYLNEIEYQDQLAQEREFKPMRWIKNHLPIDTNSGENPVFLIEPVVLVGDLDKDIAGRIK
jgi:hypothetical protein